MKQDPKVTQAIQDWLNTPQDERDIRAGAELMLSLNRNRALYNSLLKNPAKFAPHLEYELKKFLKLRLANMAVADVVRMEASVIPSVEKTIGSQVPVIDSSHELQQASVQRGRRADHDSLPDEIKALWETNGVRYRKIVLLYNELKAMNDSAPCDRYEKLVLLDELDKTYRANLERYDNFIAGTSSPMTTVNVEDAESSASTERLINNARKSLSKYRKQLDSLAQDSALRGPLLEKMQSTVTYILTAGGSLADSTRDYLVSVGIKLQ